VAAPIAAVTGVPSTGAAQRTAASGAAADGGFAEALGMLVGSVEASTAGANSAVSRMLSKTGDVHDAMIALHHAETSLQLTVQVRNKLVQAYQEIMRMPI
jgi:flagellar hook-basal body complex protein FliE